MFMDICNTFRFAELSWFWDLRQQWILPFRCTACKQVICADHISKTLGQECFHGQAISLLCPHCCRRVQHTVHYATGDPRNIALIAHWDGWQPFSTSLKHSCGMNFWNSSNDILQPCF